MLRVFVSGRLVRSMANWCGLWIGPGSDAVDAAENFIERGGKKTGETSIQTISQAYGAQAVVISIGTKRVYVIDKEAADPKHVVVELDEKNAGPGGEGFVGTGALSKEAMKLVTLVLSVLQKQLSNLVLVKSCSTALIWMDKEMDTTCH